MRNLLLSVLSFLVLAWSAAVVQADTIYLKNGSVLKGKVSSFADDQFVIMLDAGGGRYLSRAMIYMGDVSRIEFDGAPSSAGESPTSSRESSPRVEVIDPPREKPREPEATTPTRTSDPPPTEKPTEKPMPTESSEPEKKPTKPTGLVRTQTVDIAAKRDWTSTGLIVKRGDRVSITASGTVTLDPAGSRTSGPEGIDLPDSRKLMGDQPTGALIAVIGADNDDFIFIGRATEFTATREGLLFLSVNEGALSDNSGSYKAVIEVTTPRGK